MPMITPKFGTVEVTIDGQTAPLIESSCDFKVSLPAVN